MKSKRTCVVSRRALRRRSFIYFLFFCCYMCMSGNCTGVVSFLKCEMAGVQVWYEPLLKFLYPPHFDSKILAKCQRSRRERQQVAASFFFSPLFDLGNTCALTTTCKPKVHEQEKKTGHKTTKVQSSQMSIFRTVVHVTFASRREKNKGKGEKRRGEAWLQQLAKNPPPLHSVGWQQCSCSDGSNRKSTTQKKKRRNYTFAQARKAPATTLSNRGKAQSRALHHFSFFF